MVVAWPEKQGFRGREPILGAVMPRQRGVRAPGGAVGGDGRGMGTGDAIYKCDSVTRFPRSNRVFLERVTLW